MKVGFLIYKGEHLAFAQTGFNFYRYVHELYTRMRGNGRGVRIDAIESYKPCVGRGLSMLFENAFRDFEGYDVLHNVDLAPIFPTRSKAALISTAHDFQFVIDRNINKSLMTRAKDMLWLQMIVRMSMRSMMLSDYLIAVSSLTRDDAVMLGYDKRKIFLINHGIDDRFMTPIAEKKRTNKFVVGSMGVFAPRKNMPFAVKAFGMINDSNINFQVWGKKSYDYKQVEALACGNSRISFEGFAPDDRIVDIYDGFDVFLFPSFYEGFGIPIIEAQSRGLPVITYKNAKLPAEVRKYCIEAQDEAHMAQIIEDIKANGYSESKRKATMTYARTFTWDKCTKKTIDAYIHVAENGA